MLCLGLITQQSVLKAEISRYKTHTHTHYTYSDNEVFACTEKTTHTTCQYSVGGLKSRNTQRAQGSRNKKKSGGVLKALKYDNPGIFKDSELI